MLWFHFKRSHASSRVGRIPPTLRAHESLLKEKKKKKKKTCCANPSLVEFRSSLQAGRKVSPPERLTLCYRRGTNNLKPTLSRVCARHHSYRQIISSCAIISHAGPKFRATAGVTLPSMTLITFMCQLRVNMHVLNFLLNILCAAKWLKPQLFLQR